MNYIEFKEAIKERVEGELNDGSSVSIGTVLKNNTTLLDSLNISREDVLCSPNFYLNYYYDRYEQGDSIEDMVDYMINTYNSARKQQKYHRKDMDLKNVRQKIVFRIISSEKNILLLESTPHIEFLDLAVVFYIVLSADDKSMASILITDSLLEKWNLTLNELFMIAKMNTVKILQPEIMPMSSVVSEFMSETERNKFAESSGTEEMYVVTNSYRVYGACAIICPEVQKAVMNILKHDFYILPSSIHEVIVMRTDLITDTSYLTDMIRSINVQCLSKDEILSDNLYIYRSDSGMIDMIE